MTLLIAIPSIVQGAGTCIGYNPSLKRLECYIQSATTHNCVNPGTSAGTYGPGWEKLGSYFGQEMIAGVRCLDIMGPSAHEFCKIPSGACYPKSKAIEKSPLCATYPKAPIYKTYLDCINSRKMCGAAPCPSGEDCISNKCWKKVSTEDNDANCKKKAQSLLSYKYDGATKACYLSGDALKKFNEQSDDIIKVYNEIKPPKNTIRIPGLDFASISSTLDAEGYIYMPWIGQYVTTVYKFALVAASLIAVLMILIQGLTIMAGQGMATVEKWDGDSGSKQKQQVALQKIGKILVGLIIAWSSYTILYMINPALVEFKSLKVKYVKQEAMPPIDVITEPIVNVPITKGNNNVPDFKQFDKQWGAIKFGEASNCSTMQAAGCGPTSLSMVFSWYGVKATPVDTAKFIGKPGNGRVCPGGTSMNLAISKLSTSPWSNYSGKKISKTETLTSLKSGIPIIILCRKCTGQGVQGPKSYGGHYMVLTGIDTNGNITVNDPGANSQKAIKNMSTTQIDNNGGFWIIYPNKKDSAPKK